MHNLAGGSPNNVIDAGRLTITLLNVISLKLATCRTCKKTGHVAVICNSGKGHTSPLNRSPVRSRPQSTEGKSTSTTAHYGETEEVGNVLDELQLYAIGATSSYVYKSTTNL